MAESKQNQEHMTIEAFRAKKAASSPTKPIGSPSKSPPQNSSKPSTAQSRPASASRESATKRYVSTENLSGRGGPSLDERQEKVKNLREKQAEERRRKNEERRAAFEERRRRKEENEKERWAALKEQAAQLQASKENSLPLKPGSGRKLPNLPHDGSAKQPGSSLAAPNRPSSLPRPLNRPSSANPMKSPTTGVQKTPLPRSNDNLLRGSAPKELLSPTPTPSRVEGSLGGNKSVSAGSLDSSSSANRRASDSAVGHRPMSGSKQKSRPASQHSSSLALNKQDSKKTTSQELIPSAGKLSKAHSTSSLQKVGHGGEKVRKAESKPKAGITDEKTAKQALAERRKKAREEAERQAALDKERQEAERLKKEEEERLQAEEEAKEEARMRELAELLRKQEEERLLLAAEEKERKDKEEAERIAAEKVRKEEEEKKAREEEERRAKEDEERRKQEEAARLERKRRVEQIMSRTRRQTASPTTTEEISSAALQEAKENDPEDTKRKVSEILQKVKGASSVQSTSNSTFVFENSLQSGGELETAGTVNTVIQRTTDSVDWVENSLEAKEYDAEYTSNNVSEILQRNKGTSMYQATHTPTTISIDELHTVRTAMSEMRGNAQLDSVGNNIESTISGHSVEINGHDLGPPGQSVNNGALSQSFTNVQPESSHFVTTSRTASGEHRKENIPCHVGEEFLSQSSKEGFHVEGSNEAPVPIVFMDGETAMRPSHETKQDTVEHSSEVASGYCMDDDDDDEMLWLRVEATMKTREQQAVERLENLGVVAEGDDDGDSEEGQLWKVVEGKIQLTEVV